MTRVEFWTTDATTGVVVRLYDDFDGAAPSNLLVERLGTSFGEAGYHSVALDSAVAVTGGDDVFVLVRIVNLS